MIIIFYYYKSPEKGRDESGDDGGVGDRVRSAALFWRGVDVIGHYLVCRYLYGRGEEEEGDEDE